MVDAILARVYWPVEKSHHDRRNQAAEELRECNGANFEGYALSRFFFFILFVLFFFFLFEFIYIVVKKGKKICYLIRINEVEYYEVTRGLDPYLTLTSNRFTFEQQLFQFSKPLKIDLSLLEKKIWRS